MKEWELFFATEAEDDLKGLSKPVRERIIDKLAWMQNNFQDITPLTLRHELRGFFNIKIGDWRVIYKIEWQKNTIIVIAVGHRTKIYKTK